MAVTVLINLVGIGNQRTVIFIVANAVAVCIQPFRWIVDKRIAVIANAVIIGIGIYLLRNLNKEEHETILQKLRYLWVYCLEKTK